MLVKPMYLMFWEYLAINKYYKAVWLENIVTHFFQVCSFPNHGIKIKKIICLTNVLNFLAISSTWFFQNNFLKASQLYCLNTYCL